MQEDILGMKKDYDTGFADGYDEGVSNGVMAERRAHRKSTVLIWCVLMASFILGVANTAWILYFTGII